MFQLGDRVMYGMHGVCQIVDTEQRVIDRKKISYLALEPVGQPGSRYLVPTHNAVAMSKLSAILDRQTMEALLCDETLLQAPWIQDENQRKQCYRDQIGSGSREELIKLCAALYRHRQTQSAVGRKVHQCDENFLRDAERLLCSEIELVMEMSPEEAKQYLRTSLTKA